MNRKKYLAVLLGLSTLLPVHAAYVNGEMLFEETFASPESLSKWKISGKVTRLEKGGPDNGPCVKLEVPKHGNASISLSLDPKKITGMIAFEAMVKGENLRQGIKPFFGPKFMLFHTNGKKSSWPEPMLQRGTYDWKPARKLILLPSDTRRMVLSTGIQEASGAFYVSRIRIYRVKEVPDSEVKAPPNPEAARIPRGTFRGTKYRGFMSGSDLSPEAFAVLKQWNANLLRYQLNPKRGRDVSTPEKYLAWIDDEIRNIDAILKLCEKNGIKVVLDLHRGPGTSISKVASNILSKGTSLETLDEAWRRLAKHFKGDRRIYGYDLLNEPVPEQYGFQRTKKNSWQQIAECLVKVIRDIDPDTPIIVAFEGSNSFLVNDRNIIYTPHFYSPHAYTHQGVLGKLKWSYPGEIDGIYWNKDQLRVAMKSIIEFQRKHNARIFIGEFSAVNTAKGADQYLKDCIELFEEYGWDWTYHAFREWPPWSIEHENWSKPSRDNPRKRVLLEALKKNRPQK